MEKAIEQSSSTNFDVHSQMPATKLQKGPLGIIKDFFHGSRKNDSVQLTVKDNCRDKMDIQMDTLQMGKKKNKKGIILSMSPRGLSSSIMPTPLGDIQSPQVKSPKHLPDGQAKVRFRCSVVVCISMIKGVWHQLSHIYVHL